MSISL
jgi:hypothetical protein